MESTKLVFTINRETFYLRIFEDKTILYSDRRWPEEWQFMPKDESMSKRVLLSRNKIPRIVLDWINESNSGKNLEEYQNAQTINDLIIIVKRDAHSKGAIFERAIVEDVEK